MSKLKRKIVCLDTNILIWGIQKIALPEHADKIEKAKYLFEQLQEEKAEVIIPAIILSEFLIGIDSIDQPLCLKEIHRHCKIYPFDVPAALKLSEMLKNMKHNGVYARLEKEGCTKRTIKFDSLLVATALAQKVSILYTYDKAVRLIAEKEGIEVRGLPELPTHNDLFSSHFTNKTIQ